MVAPPDHLLTRLKVHGCIHRSLVDGKALGRCQLDQSEREPEGDRGKAFEPRELAGPQLVVEVAASLVGLGAEACGAEPPVLVAIGHKNELETSRQDKVSFGQICIAIGFEV